MVDLTFRHLRYFDAFARHLHFGRAALEVAVTQPALSMQIADLEARLGAQLIERTRRSLTLTSEGAEFARRSQRILADMRDLIDHAQKNDRFSRGPLRLGAIPSVAPYVLPRLLPKLRSAYPDLEINLRETLTRQLTQELLDGKLDLLLLALPLETPGIETLALLEDRFLLAVPHGYGAPEPLLSVEEIISQETLLLLEEGHCLRDQALSFCNLGRDSQLNLLGVSSISTVVQMVANGHGVTLLPEIAAEFETRHSDIRLMRFSEPQPSRNLGLAWRSGSPYKSEFLQYGELICQSMQTLEPDKPQAARQIGPAN